MYRVILTKIFIVFDVNVLNYKDSHNIKRDHGYNSIKLRKLGMIFADNVWIYDPFKEPIARKLELSPRQRSSNISQPLIPLHQPQSTFENGSLSAPLITLQSIHDMQSEILRQISVFHEDITKLCQVMRRVNRRAKGIHRRVDATQPPKW